MPIPFVERTRTTPTGVRKFNASLDSKSVEIYDTTLRDGSQLEGISLTVEDKLRIAEQLDQLGVHFIEGGWPGANPKDDEFFNVAKMNFSSNDLSSLHLVPHWRQRKS